MIYYHLNGESLKLFSQVQTQNKIMSYCLHICLSYNAMQPGKEDMQQATVRVTTLPDTKLVLAS